MPGTRSYDHHLLTRWAWGRGSPEVVLDGIDAGPQTPELSVSSRASGRSRRSVVEGEGPRPVAKGVSSAWASTRPDAVRGWGARPSTRGCQAVRRGGGLFFRWPTGAIRCRQFFSREDPVDWRSSRAAPPAFSGDDLAMARQRRRKARDDREVCPDGTPSHILLGSRTRRSASFQRLRGHRRVLRLPLAAQSIARLARRAGTRLFKATARVATSGGGATWSSRWLNGQRRAHDHEGPSPSWPREGGSGAERIEGKARRRFLKPACIGGGVGALPEMITAGMLPRQGARPHRAMGRPPRARP